MSPNLALVAAPPSGLIRIAGAAAGAKIRAHSFNGRGMKKASAVSELIALGALGAASCFAQQPPPVDAGPPLSAAQLDSLTAPVALYPDALIAQILTAATYPLEVVEAAHWLEEPSNEALRGDALAAALELQGWDLSVKSLVPFPDTLRMMERNLQWTEQIGDAFLAQQSDVMDSIQRLRRLAIAAGTLSSTPQQTVSTEDGEIIVQPVGPDVVYVPYYDPAIVYGPWPWVESWPFILPPPPGIYAHGPGIVFGVGFGVVGPLWGWSYWSWPHHDLFIHPNRPHTLPMPPDRWRHDPDHRRGVPYRYRDRDRDREAGHIERPSLPAGPPRLRNPAPGERPGADRGDRPPLRQPPLPGTGPKYTAPSPGQPRGEHPPRVTPSPDRSGGRTGPAAHPPRPPDTHAPDDGRARARPPADHPRLPTVPPTHDAAPAGQGHENRAVRGGAAAGSAGSRAQSPPSGPARGAPADRPARGPVAADRPAAPRAREPPPKPQ